MTLDEIFPRTKFPLRAQAEVTITKNGLTLTVKYRIYFQRPPGPPQDLGGEVSALTYNGRVILEVPSISSSMGPVTHFQQSQGDWAECTEAEMEQRVTEVMAQLVQQCGSEDLVREVVSMFNASIDHALWEPF